jgi:hypothetical protein
MKRQRRSLQTRDHRPVSTEDLALELRAALGASRELGPDREDVIVGSFLERVNQVIDARVEARLDESPRGKRDRRGRTLRLFLALTLAVPLTAIAFQFGMPAVALTWAAIFLMTVFVR